MSEEVCEGAGVSVEVCEGAGVSVEVCEGAGVSVTSSDGGAIIENIYLNVQCDSNFSRENIP